MKRSNVTLALISVSVAAVVSTLVFFQTGSLVPWALLLVGTIAVEVVGVVKWDWSPLGLTKPSKSDAFIVVGSAVVGAVASGVLGALLLLSPVEPAMHITFQENASLTLGVFVSSAIVAPVIEEFVFRHIIQRRGLSWASPSVRVVLPTLLFNALHVSAYPGGNSLAVWLTVAVILPVGFAFAVGYELTDNLLVPICTHSLINAVSVVALFLLFF